MSEVSNLAANAVLLLHALFVLFVVAGQIFLLLGWWRRWHWTRRPVWRVLHLLAIGVVVTESWCDVMCPLTSLESWLRRHAGAVPYHDDFITYWIGRLLFYDAPPWIFTLLYSAFAVLVVATFLLYPPRLNAGCKQGSNVAK